jgi:hypothetical protein
MPEGLSAGAGMVNLDAGETLAGNGNLLVATAPVRHASGESIGTAVVGFRRARIDAVIREARRNQLMVVASLLVVGTLAATILMSLLLPGGHAPPGPKRISREI